MQQTDIFTSNFNLYSSKLEKLQVLEQRKTDTYNLIIKDTAKLPIIRDKTFPNGTEEDKVVFQEFIKDKNSHTVALRTVEQDITKISKFLSAIRYHNYIINRVNRASLILEKIVAVSFSAEKDQFEVSLIENGDAKNFTIKKNFINLFLEDNADIVVVFGLTKDSGEIYAEYIEGFDIHADGSKFISLQHLLRHETNFELATITQYRQILECSENSNFSELLLTMFLSATGQ